VHFNCAGRGAEKRYLDLDPLVNTVCGGINGLEKRQILKWVGASIPIEITDLLERW